MNGLAQISEDSGAAAATQYLRFLIGPHAFALPLSDLLEILRVPPIALVPLSPPSLRGLVNHRGVVLPIINLHQLFGVPWSRDSDPSSRVLVLGGDYSVGFVVDRVSGIFSVDTGQIEEEGGSAKIDKNYLAGIVRNNKEVSMLVNFSKIMEKEFIASKHRQHHYEQFSDDQPDTESEQQARLVTFRIADQEYAFPVESVEEIVFLQERILQIPNADSTVAGVVELHDILLPVFHLRALLSFPAVEASADSRIIVITIQIESHQRQVGLLVDSVCEVLQVLDENLETVPKFFGHESAHGEITAICRLPEQERLISVLSGEALFGAQQIQALIESLHEADADESGNEAADVQNETQLVIFRLVDEEFALPTEAVQEILNLPTLLPLPKAPGFIAGIFNYRGTVTPVVNQRRRMNLPDIDNAGRQRVMMLDLNGTKTGFLVDGITEILRVPNQLFEDPPELFQSHLHMVQKVVHPSPTRMILMLDTEQLLNSVELKALTKASKEKLE